MGKRKRRGKLNWRSKRANKGRKPCLGQKVTSEKQGTVLFFTFEKQNRPLFYLKNRTVPYFRHIDIKIELRDKYAKSPPCLKLDILNLSAIGAYIYGCDKFKLGDEVTLKLKLLPTLQEIELEAKVVWLPDKQIQHHLYPGMGIEFCNISSSVQEKLLEFIERNLSRMSMDGQVIGASYGKT